MYSYVEPLSSSLLGHQEESPHSPGCCFLYLLEIFYVKYILLYFVWKNKPVMPSFTTFFSLRVMFSLLYFYLLHFCHSSKILSFPLLPFYFSQCTQDSYAKEVLYPLSYTPGLF